MKKLMILMAGLLLAMASYPVAVNAAWMDSQTLNQVNLGNAINGLPTISGRWIFADMRLGNESYNGLSPSTAVCSLQTAVGLLRNGYGDGIALLTRDTSTSFSWTVTKPCTVAKYGVTIFGVDATNGFFNRARITTIAKATSCPFLLVVTGSNNRFINLHLNNGDTLGMGCIEVSGARNYFENVHAIGGSFSSSTHVADSASTCDLKISAASENRFVRCTFGTNSTIRTPAADQGEIWLEGAQGQNFFEDCYVLSQSTTNGHGSIRVGADGTLGGWTVFRNCTFLNYTVSESPSNCESLVEGIAQTAHAGLLFHNCVGVGYTMLDNIDSDVSFTVGTSVTGDSLMMAFPR